MEVAGETTADPVGRSMSGSAWKVAAGVAGVSLLAATERHTFARHPRATSLRRRNPAEALAARLRPPLKESCRRPRARSRTNSQSRANEPPAARRRTTAGPSIMVASRARRLTRSTSESSHESPSGVLHQGASEPSHDCFIVGAGRPPQSPSRVVARRTLIGGSPFNDSNRASETFCTGLLVNQPT